MSHGNAHAQRRRRRRNFDKSLYQNDLYLLIDGNYSHYPYCYCKYHKGFLTKNLACRHKCEAKNCIQFSFDLRKYEEKIFEVIK